MATPPPRTTPLVDVVAELHDLRIRCWRWPGGRLALWPPPPLELGEAVRAHKPALLDLVDARGDAPPEWARSPNGEGWYDTPWDDQIRLLPEGGYATRVKPEVWAAQQARWAAYTDAEKQAMAEACLSDDVEPWDL